MIATVGTGYADGYPWSLGNRGVASVGGHRVPVVGRVSMDLIGVDITHLSETPAALDILGPHQTVDDLATAADTIGYEILTSLGARHARRYVGG